jgi:hypothetical protein
MYQIILSLHNFTNLSCNASSGTKRKTFDTPETSMKFDELVRREQFQVGFPAKQYLINR